ncbi:MAG: hypothetical protein KIH64_007685 [Mycobacterium sp.]|nr:hypothetical protein [Mycobacterium sp.]
MASILITSTVLAGAFAAAIALAPGAAADDTDGVSGRDTGRSSSQAAGTDRNGPYRPGPVRKPARPEVANSIPGWANEALWARPGPGGSNPFGSLPKPPIFALD